MKKVHLIDCFRNFRFFFDFFVALLSPLLIYLLVNCAARKQCALNSSKMLGFERSLINLLPWRTIQQTQEKNQLTLGFGVAALSGCLCAAAIYFYVEMKVKDESQAIHYLKEAIRKCEIQIDKLSRLKKMKKKVLSQMNVIYELDKNRVLTTHLFYELTQVIPSGVFLDHLQQIDHRVTVHGFAESNADVSLLMKQIINSAWIKKPLLTEIKQEKRNDDQGISSSSEFKLEFSLRPGGDKR